MASRDTPISVQMHFKYDGGLASSGSLEIYDAAVALRGISRALAITTHAFVNNGEIRSRAERANGARILLHPPVRGSFDQLVTILLDPATVAGTIGISVASNALWDFIKVTWSKAVGLAAEPSTPTGRRLQDRIEPVFGELADVLEPALKDMHRPIQSDAETEMQLVRPRVGAVLTLDTGTLAYVSTLLEDPDQVLIAGNVTRYNVITGYGRLYDDAEEQTIPFNIDPSLERSQRELLTWSLDARNRGLGDKLLFGALPVRNARRDIERYIVRSVSRAPAAPSSGMASPA